jgi:signal transduction histidine kinase
MSQCAEPGSDESSAGNNISVFPLRPPLDEDETRAVFEQTRALLNRRVTAAIWVGVIAYFLNCIEQWFALHDVKLLSLQLVAEILLLTLALISRTRWGASRRVVLFHIGYGVVLVVYEITVVDTKAFGTVWGDGFAEAFGFYCLLIPVSVRQTALVGLAAALLLSIPEAVTARTVWPMVVFVIGNITAFVILIGSRWFANASWVNEIIAMRQQAVAAQRQIDTADSQLEFVSAISHELRNPLTVLCSTSEQLLAGRFADPNTIADRYRMLVRESDRLRRRVEGLVDFGRMLGPDAATYRFEYLDPAELVSTVVREFESSGTAPDYSVDVEISDESPLVKGDSHALSSVLWNLLDNAVKYSPTCRTIWVRVGRVGQFASISIRDEGKGISDADRKLIFAKYKRGDSGRDASGTGIGLWMVQCVVLAHKGLIELDSNVGHGSMFTVLLPAAAMS